MRDRIENLCDMVEHCRARLDDVSPVATEPTTDQEALDAAAEEEDESDLLWTTQELVAFANQAVRQVAIRARCIRDAGRDKPGITTFTVTAGTKIVAMDPRILHIKRVWWVVTETEAETVLGTFSERQADEESDTWRADSATPTAVCLRQTERALLLADYPDADGVLSIECIREPVTLMELTTEAAQTAEIPVGYLPDCLHWMCHLAYLKNDADTFDPKKAAEFAALFTAAVGPLPTVIELDLDQYQQGRRRPRASFY